ncbi:hypothetical protein B0H12DRAFT_1067232 [Mycena haematopus]|nr:hypothetical protein B0H12DRAFT_1067232 [Mycena haematopus]
MAADYSRTAVIQVLMRETEGSKSAAWALSGEGEVATTSATPRPRRPILALSSTAVVALDNQSRPSHPCLSRLSTSSDLPPARAESSSYASSPRLGMWAGSPSMHSLSRPQTHTQVSPSYAHPAGSPFAQTMSPTTTAMTSKTSKSARAGGSKFAFWTRMRGKGEQEGRGSAMRRRRTRTTSRRGSNAKPNRGRNAQLTVIHLSSLDDTYARLPRADDLGLGRGKAESDEKRGRKEDCGCKGGCVPRRREQRVHRLAAFREVHTPQNDAGEALPAPRGTGARARRKEEAEPAQNHGDSEEESQTQSQSEQEEGSDFAGKGVRRVVKSEAGHGTKSERADSRGEAREREMWPSRSQSSLRVYASGPNIAFFYSGTTRAAITCTPDSRRPCASEAPLAATSPASDSESESDSEDNAPLALTASRPALAAAAAKERDGFTGGGCSLHWAPALRELRTLVFPVAARAGERGVFGPPQEKTSSPMRKESGSAVRTSRTTCTAITSPSGVREQGSRECCGKTSPAKPVAEKSTAPPPAPATVGTQEVPPPFVERHRVCEADVGRGWTGAGAGTVTLTACSGAILRILRICSGGLRCLLLMGGGARHQGERPGWHRAHCDQAALAAAGVSRPVYSQNRSMGTFCALGSSILVPVSSTTSTFASSGSSHPGTCNSTSNTSSSSPSHADSSMSGSDVRPSADTKPMARDSRTKQHGNVPISAVHI